MGFLFDLLTGLASAFLSLGPGGMFSVTLGALLLYFGFKFFDKADRMLERVERRWRRWSTPTRWSMAVLAAALLGPAIWAVLPKSDVALSVGLGLYALYCAQGGHFITRYDMTNATARSAWAHHLSVTRAARKHTQAINDASPKKGGKASKPTPHATGETYVAQPGFGESAADFAERINLGETVSAEKARTGKDIHGISASPLPDGSVQVVIEHVPSVSPDPLTEPRWWKSA